MSGISASDQHKLSRTSEYSVWKNMRYRCRSHPNWAGRGIKVCSQWSSFAVFLQDMGPRPVGMTIERKDNDGDYELGNCVWATRKVQARNRRSGRQITIDGVTRSMIEWCELAGISKQNASNRVRACGWSVKDAVTLPHTRSISRG